MKEMTSQALTRCSPRRVAGGCARRQDREWRVALGGQHPPAADRLGTGVSSGSVVWRGDGTAVCPPATSTMTVLIQRHDLLNSPHHTLRTEHADQQQSFYYILIFTLQTQRMNRTTHMHSVRFTTDG